MSKQFSIQDLSRIAQAVDPRSDSRLHPFVGGAEANDNDLPTSVAFKNIARGCKAANELIETAENHSYDQWLTLAQLFSRIDDGRRMFHEVSSGYLDYDRSEADRQFDKARHDMKPPICRRLEEVTGGEACRGCAFYGTINSPMKLPHVPLELVELMSEYVVVVNPPSFAHVESGRLYAEKAFEQKFGHLITKHRVTNSMVNSKAAGKVERIVYKPGKPTGMMHENGELVLNTWRDTGIEPDPGDFGTITEHLTNLVPNAEERNHVLNYLAHLVQKPGKKIKHVILIIGGQGIGKSAIGVLVKRLLGGENVRDVGPAEAEGRFRARWGNQQLLIFEEMMANNRLQFYNDLKPWISEETATVEEKHIAAYSASTPRGFLAFSNEQIPTRLAADDRRFFVIRSEMTQQSPDYYNQLFDAINGQEAAAFKECLLKRDISGFRADGPPPVTEAKTDLIEDTRAPVESRIEALIDRGLGAFAKDLVTLDMVQLSATEHGEPKPSISAVSAAMRELGHKALPKQTRLEDQTRPRLWAIHNHEKWLKADTDEIRKEMSSN